MVASTYSSAPPITFPHQLFEVYDDFLGALDDEKALDRLANKLEMIAMSLEQRDSSSRLSPMLAAEVATVAQNIITQVSSAKALATRSDAEVRQLAVDLDRALSSVVNVSKGQSCDILVSKEII